jgi:hypothetical protein
MSLYEFPHPRRPARPHLEQPHYETTPQEEPIGHIQGQVPDSKEEWWVSRALDRLRLSYTYQYPVNGGRARGGYMIDFLVDTVPLKTMIEPIGNHWHTGELGSDDQKRQADIESLMRDIARIPILNLWIPDLINEDAVYMRLRSELG